MIKPTKKVPPLSYWMKLGNLELGNKNENENENENEIGIENENENEIEIEIEIEIENKNKNEIENEKKCVKNNLAVMGHHTHVYKYL